jgi:hypothetical protein
MAGRRGDGHPSQTLDDVKKLTLTRCGRRKESATGAPRDGAPILREWRDEESVENLLRMLKKARLLTHPTPARQDAPFRGQSRKE